MSYNAAADEPVEENAPGIDQAVHQLVQFCEERMKDLGQARRDAAQEMRGKSPEEIEALIMAGTENALVYHNATVQAAIMGDHVLDFAIPCRVFSGPMITAQVGRMQTKVQRAVKAVVKKETDRRARLARLERSQDAAARKADAQHAKEEKKRQAEAARRAKKQEAARKKRATARAKAMRKRMKAAEGSDILAMPDPGAGEWEGDMDEEEEEEEQDMAGAAASPGRAHAPDWGEAEAELAQEIEELVEQERHYASNMREAVALSVQDEQEFVSNLVNSSPSLAAAGNAYVKSIRLAGVTVLKNAVLPDAPVFHLRPARAALMRQCAAGGSRGALCPSSGQEHGTAVHGSIQRIAAAVPTCMRNGVPGGLDPCVIPILTALRARNLVLVASEVRVVDALRAAGTYIDMVCVNVSPGQHGAVVLIELKTGSAGCFDTAHDGDPEVTFTTPAADGSVTTHTERHTPLVDAQLQMCLTLAMIQGAHNVHGLQAVVMHVPDRFTQAVLYQLPDYMHDGQTMHAVYKRALQNHMAPASAARLGLVASAGSSSSGSSGGSGGSSNNNRHGRSGSFR